jgi:predicted amidophosphoribosyltransferase
MRSRVLIEVVALVAPPRCAACDVVLAGAAEVLCARCRRELPWLRGPRCRRCALPAPCAPCPAAGATFDEAFAPMAHRGPARRLVAALKFEARLALADLMAAQIAATAPLSLLAGALVPVPAPRRRHRARGFDQAEALAGALARRTGLALWPCLARTDSGPRRVGMPRRDRLGPGRPTVEARRAVPVRAVVVDDVHTTGATLHACARALQAAGTREVAALTYTRTLR